MGDTPKQTIHNAIVIYVVIVEGHTISKKSKVGILPHPMRSYAHHKGAKRLRGLV